MPMFSSLSDVLLGPNRQLHATIRLTLMVSALYVFNTILTLLALPLGYVSPDMAPYMVACMLTGASMFYGLLRSGWSEYLSDDPKLVIPQSVYCAFAVCLGYLTTHMPLRNMVLAFLPAILLPCQFALSPKQLQQITGVMVAMLGATLGLSRWVHPGESEPVVDALKFAYLSALMLGACWVAQRVSRIHHEMHAKGDALTKALSKVEHMASHDPLTGLFNRRRMHEILSQEWLRVQRQARPTSLVMMDLDHFKQINDQFGHQVGDEVLRAFAVLAGTHLRDADVIARWGGEEFLVLCPDSDTDQVMVGLNRLRSKLSRQPLLPDRPELKVSFSAGIAALQANETMGNAINRADLALYQAKKAGRGQSVRSP